jgi:uncharacterized protein (DUF924 family)
MRKRKGYFHWNSKKQLDSLVTARPRNAIGLHAPPNSTLPKYAALDEAIIDGFGRYPHPHYQRCAILGRSATGQELAFLSGPGSSF